jgi:membrane protein
VAPAARPRRARRPRNAALPIADRSTIRRGAAAVVRSFADHDLLTYSSAIAFQVVYAAVPIALVALATLGLVGGQSLYTHHLADTLRHALAPDAFRVVDRSARRAMSTERLWWATLGLGVTLWAVGAAIRSMMAALNAIYGTDETRSWLRRFAVSIGAGVLVTLCVCGAIMSVLAGRLLGGGSLGPLVAVGRWVLALALLALANALVIRLVPSTKRPAHWVSIGSGLAIVCWLVATIGFATWVSFVPYASVYGALATVVLILMYFHIATIGFLVGVVVDSVLREEVSGRRS